MATQFDVKTIEGDLVNGVLEQLKTLGIDALKEATVDVPAFIGTAVPALTRYGSLYLGGQITEDEFKSLVASMRDEGLEAALTMAGWDVAKIQEHRNSIFNVVTSIVMGALKSVI